ncbi:MAG: hypothetical protein Q9195_002687 [Heterodermia aff. obscurata]
MPRFSIFRRSTSTPGSSNAHDQNTYTAIPNQPPAYTSTDDATSDEQANSDKHWDSSSAHSSASSDQLAEPDLFDIMNTVPICPHQWLTSARVALISDLPGLKPIDQSTKPKEIDALLSNRSAHHRLQYGSEEDVQFKTTCEPLGPLAERAQSLIQVQGEGHYMYTFSPHGARDDAARPERTTPCLVLCMTWTIYLSSKHKTAKTIKNLRQEVEKADVKLCAHRWLHDREILKTIHEAVNPDVGLRDPLVRYSVEEGYNCELERCFFGILGFE